MGAAAIVPMMILSTGMQVYGQMQQSKMAKKTAEYNAKVQENEALRAQQEGMESARRFRDDASARQARIRAMVAKSGVSSSTGSPLMVMAEQAGRDELQALDIERGAKTESSRLRTQAGITRMEGAQISKAKKIGAGVSLLKGATSIAGQYN